MFTEQKKKSQKKRTLEALKRKPATSMMLSVELGILRANLTRYLREFEQQGKVVVLKEDACKKTGHKAKYYSARPEHFPKERTPDLFPTKSWGV